MKLGLDYFGLIQCDTCDTINTPTLCAECDAPTVCEFCNECIRCGN